uniref:Thioredoxin-like fold domain-containing protein MRL7, chloroplastic n=1 Tax=Tanacetum cinerariifolium TaxID=118510 RepID=A0A6L2LKE3_TANCI|nr:thioredoxin-like fold domain-containing protein MRL7, chloroplastic [Tanacetum cinerariifolium]
MALNPTFHFHKLSTFRHLYQTPNTNLKIPHAIPKDNSNPPIKPSKKPKKPPKTSSKSNLDDQDSLFTTIPPKPRKGRKSEASAVEDLIRNSLEETFAAIREQNQEFNDVGNVFKDDVVNEEDEKSGVVEEDDPNWPVDAEIGWGIRASEYFEKHPIKNVVGEDGVEIDWEGELDDNLVKEINCLEWESFAFHPSPLIVLVFERYNRASENWRALKELEKAAKVYWNAKDRLPPRTVKLDMNIETDLAYALKVRECPQLLFLRGNRIIYREPQIRTADELVQMMAHFYYKARKPSWMKDAQLYS